MGCKEIANNRHNKKTKTKTGKRNRSNIPKAENKRFSPPLKLGINVFHS